MASAFDHAATRRSMVGALAIGVVALPGVVPAAATVHYAGRRRLRAVVVSAELRHWPTHAVTGRGTLHANTAAWARLDTVLQQLLARACRRDPANGAGPGLDQRRSRTICRMPRSSRSDTAPPTSRFPADLVGHAPQARCPPPGQTVTLTYQARLLAPTDPGWERFSVMPAAPPAAAEASGGWTRRSFSPYNSGHHQAGQWGTSSPPGIRLRLTTRPRPLQRRPVGQLPGRSRGRAEMRRP